MEQTYLMRNGKYRLFKIGKSIDRFAHSVFEFWIRHKDNIALEEIQKRILQY